MKKIVVLIVFSLTLLPDKTNADWKYNGATYYSSIRARLNEYSELYESDGNVDKTKAISLYKDLPEFPFDFKIIQYGSSIIEEYKRPISIESAISRISFPTVPQEEFLKIFQYEPQIEERFGYFEVSQRLSKTIPVKVIFDKTFKILSSIDYLNLEIGNDSNNVNYDTMLNYLFDNNLWPNLPKRQKRLPDYGGADDDLTRQKEFYNLIVEKTPDEIQKYILLVMMYYDGVPMITFDNNNNAESLLMPYEEDNLDNWQKAWNNTIPIICDFMSSISTPKGCEQYVEE